MRPLAGVLCAGEGSFVLDGTPRMRERPIDDLVDGLLQVRFYSILSEIITPEFIQLYFFNYYYFMFHVTFAIFVYYSISWVLTLVAVTLDAHP